MIAVLLFAVWTVLALCVGAVIGLSIRTADEREGTR